MGGEMRRREVKGNIRGKAVRRVEGVRAGRWSEAGVMQELDKGQGVHRMLYSCVSI